MKPFDAVVIGAGAAGLMCAMTAGARGRRVALLDHASVIGRKIRISGGGRCNFTNTGAVPERYVSENPHFARSALARYQPEQFIELVRRHGIAFHEKTLGQLFCDGSSQAIIDLLVAECRAARVDIRLGCPVRSIEKPDGAFVLKTGGGELRAGAVVIATGGLSLPKIGATAFGYRIARQFGLRVVQTAPALDAFVFATAEQRRFAELAGISLPAVVRCNDHAFEEQVLFTHTGLSGPAALQASLYWNPSDAVHIDLCPGVAHNDLFAWLAQMKAARPRADVATVIAERLPKRAADVFCARWGADGTMAHQSAAAMETATQGLKDWVFTPGGTVGYRTAEVTRGGVDTRELSSKTMESLKVHGLYFIGEVVDVTGWLGGYNFQWAWASGWVAGQAV